MAIRAEGRKESVCGGYVFGRGVCTPHRLKGSDCSTSLHYRDGEIPGSLPLGSGPDGWQLVFRVYRLPHHLEFFSCLNIMRSVPQCLRNWSCSCLGHLLDVQTVLIGRPLSDWGHQEGFTGVQVFCGFSPCFVFLILKSKYVGMVLSRLCINILCTGSEKNVTMLLYTYKNSIEPRGSRVKIEPSQFITGSIETVENRSVRNSLKYPMGSHWHSLILLLSVLESP